MQIDHDSILTLELPYREQLQLHRTVFHGGDGPKVAVVAGIHGDELEGLVRLSSSGGVARGAGDGRGRMPCGDVSSCIRHSIRSASTRCSASCRSSTPT